MVAKDLVWAMVVLTRGTKKEPVNLKVDRSKFRERGANVIPKSNTQFRLKSQSNDFELDMS